MLCIALVASLATGCGGGGSTTGLGGGSGALTVAPAVPAAVTVNPAAGAAVVAQAQDKNASAAGIQADMKVVGLPANTDVQLFRVLLAGRSSQESVLVGSGRTNGAGEITFTDVTMNDQDQYAVRDTTGTTLASTTLRVNHKPVATVAQSQIAARVGDTVTMSGAASDPDNDQLFYEWVRVSGPELQMPGPGVASASFTAAYAGTYVCKFRVVDALGDESSANVTVTITGGAGNANPTVTTQNAAGNTGQSVSLTATATDADGDYLTWAWQQTSGPTVTLTGSATRSPSFTPVQAGTYAFTVTVSDGKGGSATATASVVVTQANTAPTASAGADRTVAGGSQVTLSGSGTDPENDTLTYSWNVVSGLAVGIVGANTATPSFTAPSSNGTILIRLTVTDTRGLTGTDDITITVQVAQPNQRPVAGVQATKWSVGFGATVQLVGTGTDPESGALTYRWTQSGSDKAKVAIQNATSATASFVTSNIVQTFAAAHMPIPATTGVLAIPYYSGGHYNFTLTVTDPGGLTGTNTIEVIAQQYNSGTTNCAIGAPVYLNGGERASYPWQLTVKPATSQATLRDATSRFASFTPDVKGAYRVVIGATTIDINASTYSGIDSCTGCHADPLRDFPGAAEFAKTFHPQKLALHLNGVYGASGYRDYCLRCHTNGYDPAAANGGFDEKQTALGWTIPRTLAAGVHDAQPDDIKAMGGVQCESCHGPSKDHNGSLKRVAKTMAMENCAQCHSAQPAELHTAGHNEPVMDHATWSAGCAGCHAPRGYIGAVKSYATTGTPVLVGSYSSSLKLSGEKGSFSCAVCHDPHKTNTPGKKAAQGGDMQLRMFDKPMKLLNGFVVTETGASATCIMCHHARRIPSSADGTFTTSTRVGPHYSPQTEMFVGTGGYEYAGVNYNRTAYHNDTVTEKCVGCHMVEPPNKKSTEPIALAGGHTWRMKKEDGTPNVARACGECHEGLTTFDRLPIVPRDYDGNGTAEGIQSEVEGLIEALDHELTTQNPTGWARTKATEFADLLTQNQRRAAYNYIFVHDDGSHGIHNPIYTIQLLQQSLKSLKGGTLPAAMYERK